MGESSLELKISEGQIQNAIAVALTEAFSPERRDALLRDVVRAHMNVTVNSYDRRTILQKAVGETVRAMAMERTKTLVDSWRPDVDAIVEAALGASYKEAVMKQLKDAVGRLVVAGITIEARANFNE